MFLMNACLPKPFLRTLFPNTIIFTGIPKIVTFKNNVETASIYVGENNSAYSTVCLLNYLVAISNNVPLIYLTHNLIATVLGVCIYLPQDI